MLPTVLKFFSLILYGFVGFTTGRYMLGLVLFFVLMILVLFRIAITLLGGERAGLYELHCAKMCLWKFSTR